MNNRYGANIQKISVGSEVTTQPKVDRIEKRRCQIGRRKKKLKQSYLLLIFF